MANNSFKPSPLRGLGAKPVRIGRAGLTQALGHLREGIASVTRSALGWSKAITTSHWLAVVALAIAAVSLLRTYCEGFGCIGLGIAWFAWVCFFAIAALLGLFSANRAKRVAGWQRSSRIALIVQALLGLILLGIWVRAKMA